MEFKDLAGKIISDAKVLALKGYDDTGYLLLTFADNSKALIVSDYGGFTGKSNGEYPSTISIYAGDELIKDGFMGLTLEDFEDYE